MLGSWILVALVVSHNHMREYSSPMPYSRHVECLEDAGRMKKAKVRRNRKVYLYCKPAFDFK